MFQSLKKKPGTFWLITLSVINFPKSYYSLWFCLKIIDFYKLINALALPSSKMAINIKPPWRILEQIKEKNEKDI